MVSMLSAVTANAQGLKTTEVLVDEDFEPPVGFTGEFTDVHVYYSMFNADDIATGNFTGYKGWQLAALAGDEQTISPSIFHVAQRSDVGDLKDFPTTYLDLRRYETKGVNQSIYKGFGVQDKNGLIVRFSFDLLVANGKTSNDSVYFSMAAKYFATTLTNLYWKPDSGTAQWFTEEEKALIEYQKWNKIEFLVDFDKDLVTLYINGHQVCTPQELENDTDFKEIRLWSLHGERSNVNRLCLDNLKLEKVAYVDEAYIANGVTYTKPAGSVVSAPSNGDVVKSIRVEKANEQDGNCTAIIASYNSYGNLNSAKIVPLAAANFASNIAMIDANIPYATGDYIKVFFLDKANIVRSLVSATTFLK